MSINKQALIRYYALDKCFRNGSKKFFKQDLLDACQEAIYNATGNKEGIKERQFFNDIKFMQEEGPWDISLLKLKEGKRTYYRYEDLNYSIQNTPLSEKEALLLKEALTTLTQFKGMPQLDWVEDILERLQSNYDLPTDLKTVIDFESNPYLKGLEHISPLYHAIREERPVEISYQGFTMDTPQVSLFHPHYLKQYNNRWFVFGNIDKQPDFTNYALDRIHEIKENDTPYTPSSHDYHELFEDTIGVSIPRNSEPEKVVLFIDRSQWPYIKNKPLHGSQKIVEKGDLGVTISLELYLNFELEALLLSQSHSITVLSPISLKENIKTKIEKAISNYCQ
ncbi:WYL domain-containing protein [Halosquirtibacter xylanolyticus]|uniref:helix-turn-helix transcriptional regulator n=1 Tax=Halosquirtibacter xylanolyticus TaxID=3374599 RepID=UPI0037495186|nr:WYL domain-containing protein [Prolixibacteraceae bacterium]